jgi:hypothetical protein
MKRLIPFILLILAACKQELPSIPSGILPIQKMSPILIDMHVADAVAQNRAQGGVNEKKMTQEYYERIYKIHGVTKEEFTKSYRFYEDNPALFNKLYEEVLNGLSKTESDVSK